MDLAKQCTGQKLPIASFVMFASLARKSLNLIVVKGYKEVNFWCLQLWLWDKIDKFFF
jgi:hypothetical protein